MANPRNPEHLLQILPSMLERELNPNLKLDSNSEGIMLNHLSCSRFFPIIDGKTVVKISFLRPLSNIKKKISCTEQVVGVIESEVFFLMHFKNGLTAAYKLKKTDFQRRLLTEIMDDLNALGAESDYRFVHPAKKRIDWEKSSAYFPEEEQIYNLLRPQFIKDFPQLNNKKIHLAALGCGEGKEVEEFLKLHKDATRHIIGIDICKDSLKIAKKTISHPHTKWVRGNCNNLLNFIAPITEDNTLSVGIAVGLITRQVLAGTYEAVGVLQQAFRCFDVFGLAGLSLSLISEDMARKIGWDDVILKKDTKQIQSYFYYLNKLTSKNSLVRWNKELCFLDLSLAAEPIEILKKLPKEIKTKIKFVDLSFAFILKKECEELTQQLSELPQLVRVIHDPADCLSGFLENFNYSVSGLYRRHNAADEIPLTSYMEELEICEQPQRLQSDFVTKESKVTACKSALHTPNPAKVEALKIYELGVQEYKLKNYQKSLEELLAAEKIFSALPKCKKELAMTYSTLASVHRDKMEMSIAEEYLDKAFAIYRQLNYANDSSEMLKLDEKRKTLKKEVLVLSK